MSEQTPPPTTATPDRAEVLARSDRAWDDLEAVISSADEEAMARPGDGGWSSKDHLAHVEAWERYLLAVLERRSPSAAIGLDLATYQALSEDAQNELLREQTRTQPLAAVLGDLRQTRQRVRSAILSLSGDDLAQPVAAISPDELGGEEGSLAEWIVDYCDDHLREHLDLVKQIAAVSD
jgi:hypothetical protein